MTERAGNLFFVLIIILLIGGMYGAKKDYTGTSRIGNYEYMQCRQTADDCRHLVWKAGPTPSIASEWAWID